MPAFFGDPSWMWAPLCVGALNLLALIVQLPRLLGHLYLNADIASAPMIASLIGQAPPGRVVTLGEYTWYEPLWFMRLTDSLPAHRAIWEAAPVAFSLGALALLVFTSWRVLGAWAATITGAIVVCIGTLLRYVYFSPDAHATAVVHGIVLGAVLVWLVARPQSSARLVLIGVPLAALTAAGETDLLLLVTGIVPFALAATIMWLRSRTRTAARLAVFAITVSTVATIGGALASRAMREDHVFHSPLLKLAFVNHIFSNVEVLIKATTFLGGGFFFDSAPTLNSVLAFVAGALTLIGAVYVARLLWRWAPELRFGAPPPDRSAAAREAHLTYWGLVGIAVLAGFMLTTQPFDQWSGRYLVSAFLAGAVLLPALVPNSTRVRATVSVAVAVFGLLALYDHAQEGASTYDFGQISAADARGIEAIAHREGLRYGYSGFWQAAPLTWASHVRLQVFPVDRCHKTRVCPAAVHAITSWYKPRPHTRTFFVEASRTLKNIFPAAGPPVATYRVHRFLVFVYDHDIAAEMGRASTLAGCSSITPCYGVE